MMNDNDMMRKLIELAVTSGRMLQSHETRFVHDLPNTIPIYENILFSLALFRTKTHESVQEAKLLLDKLLYFQSDGNFPVYLHDYPFCRDHYVGAKILTALFWIKKDFGHILGEVLLKRLSLSYEKLSRFLDELTQRIELPVWVKMKIGIPTPFSEEMNPALIGEMLSAIQMHEMESQEVDAFFAFLGTSWHPVCKTYVGPQVKAMQTGFEPLCTLYDYYMGYLSHGLSKRAQKPQIAALQAVLIQQTARTLLDSSECRRENWMVHKAPDFGLSLIQGASSAVGFYPLYFATEKHTLAFDIPKGEVVEAIWKDNQVELICNITDEIPLDNIEKAIVCSFFINDIPNISATVGKAATTTFLLKNEIELVVDSRVMLLKFECLEGDGMFYGHINRANRPSQTLNTGKERYDAFDIQLFLRRVRGTTKSRLKVTLKLL